MTDYFGTRQIIFGNNINAIGKMHFYSIHVIPEYNLPGSKIICHQISVSLESGAMLFDIAKSVESA